MTSGPPSGEISYDVDRADRITAVSESWTAFAVANDGGHLVPPTIVGKSLWSAISDPATRALYQTLVGRVRRGGGPSSFHFRCDSPSKRRELEMRIAARADDALRFTTSLLREEERPAVPLLDPAAARAGAIVIVCGWCARVRVPEDRWVEVEVAVRLLRLFEGTALPRLSHGICPSCSDKMIAALDAEGGGSPRGVVVGTLPAAETS